MRKRVFLIGLCLLAMLLAGCAGTKSKIQGYLMRSEEGSGIMTCSGKWLVGPVGRETGFVSGVMVDGLAPFFILEEQQFTYIDEKGQFPFAASFSQAYPFSEGLAAVLVDGQWGYIDTTGAYVIEPQFGGDHIGSFSDGLAFVGEELTDLGPVRTWVYINKQGEKVLGPYSAAYAFIDGMAGVVEPGDGDTRRQGFIDKTGKFVLELEYSKEVAQTPAGSPTQGLFPVRDIKKQFDGGGCATGFMNEKGEWVIEPQFCEVSVFQDGLARVSTGTGAERLYGYIDKTGKLVVDAQYLYSTDFSGGCAYVMWDNVRSFGLIDRLGKYIYKYEYGN